MSTRILVVDDEPDVEALVVQKFRRQVRKGEYEFLFAQDGQQALDVLEENDAIDMVLSDINMPRMDGLTLLEKLNDQHRDLKTVIVSAYGDMGNIRTAMNRGAFDFVTKPIEFDDLEATIAKTQAHLEMLRDLQQRKAEAERAQATLSRYFSPSIAEALAQNPDCMEPGGERRSATFLFTDLADFTPLVEASDSELIVSLLNEYLDQVTQIIFKHGGTIMKIVGDAVHAMFGAPLEQTDHAKRAVDCALELDIYASGFQARQNAASIPLGVTRIGINTGRAIVGNFGGEQYFDYTAHGDAVNVAARLETVNKQLGTRICVSEATAAEIEGFQGRPIGSLLLKGKTEPLRAFEPLTKARFENPATEAYEAAYNKLAANDPQARQAFATLLGQYADDPLAMFHLGRLLAGETGAEITLTEK